MSTVAVREVGVGAGWVSTVAAGLTVMPLGIVNS